MCVFEAVLYACGRFHIGATIPCGQAFKKKTKGKRHGCDPYKHPALVRRDSIACPSCTSEDPGFCSLAPAGTPSAPPLSGSTTAALVSLSDRPEEESNKDMQCDEHAEGGAESEPRTGGDVRASSEPATVVTDASRLATQSATATLNHVCSLSGVGRSPYARLRDAVHTYLGGDLLGALRIITHK